jgi:hypothetical protein
MWHHGWLCRIHGNMEMRERVAKQILELDATGYMMLLNIYVVLLATSIFAVHCQQCTLYIFKYLFWGIKP